MRHNIISVIDDEGKSLNVSGVRLNGQNYLIVQDKDVKDALNNILAQLKKMNFYLSVLTDTESEEIE